MKTVTAKHALIATALSLAVAGNAHAGIRDLFKKKADPAPAADVEQVEGQAPNDQDRPATDKRRVFKGAGIGCATGALMGLLSGNKKDALRGCVAGGVAGGIVAWQEQVNEAREVQAVASQAGMDAQVHTTQATDGQGKTGEKLQQLVIGYDPADMAALDPKTVALLDKLAGLTTRARNELTVRFEGTTACAIPFAELTKRQALERHVVDVACGSGEHRIVISPMPDVR